MKIHRNTLQWLILHIRPHFISLSVVILMGTIQSLSKVLVAVLSKQLIDAAVSGLWQVVINTGIGFVAAVAVQIFFQAFTSILTVRTSETMCSDLQQMLYQRITHAEWKEISGYHSGDIMTRMTSDIRAVVDGVLSAFPEVLSLGTGMLGAFVALFMLNPIMLLFALVLGPLALMASYLLGNRFVMIHKRTQETESKFRSYLQERMEHILILKAFCQEEESVKHFRKVQNEKIYWNIRRNYTSVISNAVLTAGYWLCFLAAFGWGAYSLNRGTVTIGTLAAFIQLIVQIQSPMIGLAGSVPQIVAVIGSAERIIEIEKLPSEKSYPANSSDQFEQIMIDRLSFEYKEKTPILYPFSTTINQGDVIGIIGASGEGKTTLLHLILSFLQPDQGEIYLSGQNSNHSIRSLISYVPQGNTLFSGTISYNLSFGCPKATMQEQIEVLKSAEAWSFVERLSKQLDTVIGEHGIGLSEGQAQRIAIARALLCKKPILVLDEATSAIDENTEYKVLQNIKKLQPARTCIIVSHRSSTLKICNRIWKLYNGVFTEHDLTISAAPTSEAV